MLEYTEQQLVSRSMVKWGGSFVSALGTALIKADSNNCQKIKSAFPEYWSKYLDMSKHLEDY